MPLDPTALPRAPDRLIEINVDLQQRNAHLQELAASLRRAVYGPQSEKLLLDGAQLQLGLPDVTLSRAHLAP